jgi:hypothetical protein
MRKTPLNSARRRNAVDGMDKPQACPPRPQENRSRRSGHMMCYQNRTTSFAIDSSFHVSEPALTFSSLSERALSQSALPAWGAPAGPRGTRTAAGPRSGQATWRAERSRTYLEDHYTNHLGEMVCQGCHGKCRSDYPMGHPVLKRWNAWSSLGKEQAENYLALCLTCAAKWRYANPVTDEDLRGNRQLKQTRS